MHLNADLLGASARYAGGRRASDSASARRVNIDTAFHPLRCRGHSEGCVPSLACLARVVYVNRIASNHAMPPRVMEREWWLCPSAQPDAADMERHISIPCAMPQPSHERSDPALRLLGSAGERHKKNTRK